FASAVNKARIAAVQEQLGRVAEVTTVLTQRPRHATELAEEACASGECGAVLVFSGDGGVNEVLNGVYRNVPIGFGPGRRTSVLPRALGLPADPVAAAARIADALAVGRTRRITLGRVNGRRFAFSAGIGLDAEAVRRMDALGRRPDGKRPGDLRFVLTLGGLVFERRGRFDPVLEIEGLGRAAFAFVAHAS